MDRHRLIASALVAAGLAACSPGLPQGVRKEAVDDAVSQAIGDPATCVLMARLSDGKQVYRYNTAMECDRALPACEGAGARKLQALLAQTAADRQPRATSCASSPDGLRSVGWASGVLPSKGLAYAAVMEGKRALPGMVMQDRLADGFKRVGLQ